MYRELSSLRQVLQQELKDTLPSLPGVESSQLLYTYLNQLTLYVGADVADQTVTLLALNPNQDELAHWLEVPNTPTGYAHIGEWLESVRVQHHLQLGKIPWVDCLGTFLRFSYLESLD